MTSPRSTFTFDTTHHALWAEEVALQRGLPVEVVPAPPESRAKCDLALVTFPDRVEELTRLLTDEGIEFSIYGGGGTPTPPGLESSA